MCVVADAVLMFISYLAIQHSPEQTKIFKRQSTGCSYTELQPIFDGFPGDCTAFFFSNDFGEVLDLDRTAIGLYRETVCNPRCGNPIITLFRRCFDEDDGAEFLINLCADNSEDNQCYSPTVLSTIESTTTTCPPSNDYSGCPANCKSRLQMTSSEIGCCIRLGYQTINYDYIDDIEENCGVALPGPCTDSTLSGAGTPFLDSFAAAICLLLAVMIKELF